MRTAGRTEMFRRVAVPTQDLEPGREPVVDQPLQHGRRLDQLAVFAAAPADMVDGQKYRLGDPAACARATVGADHPLFALRPCSPGVFGEVAWVGSPPLRHLGGETGTIVLPIPAQAPFADRSVAVAAAGVPVELLQRLAQVAGAACL